MKVEVEQTPLPGCVVLRHEFFQDQRGFFLEVYRRDVFREAGLPGDFVQLNHSRSEKNVVRGLHFQWAPPMGKLMRVTQGAAYLVAVDIRKGSPTLGRWHGVEVTAESKQQLWAPAGFARGFCVLSDAAEIEYLCTGTYNSRGESGVLWNDLAIGITWPAKDPVLSEKDRKAQTLTEWLALPESANFSFSG
jgi:dTDP-4-dehydrorhamnose 3,5-epimerase